MTVAGIYAVGVLSPGPNFLAVAHRALRHGRGEALAVAAGVVVVNALWASLALFGIALLFSLVPWSLVLFRVAGGAFLVWTGIRLWRHAGDTMDAVASAPSRGGLAAAFRAGLATNLSNAKSVAYYGSVLSAAGPAPGQVTTVLLALAIVLAIAALWYGSVALILSTGPAGRAYGRGKSIVERACGVLMVAFGLRLAANA